MGKSERDGSQPLLLLLVAALSSALKQVGFRGLLKAAVLRYLSTFLWIPNGHITIGTSDNLRLGARPEAAPSHA